MSKCGLLKMHLPFRVTCQDCHPCLLPLKTKTKMERPKFLLSQASVQIWAYLCTQLSPSFPCSWTPHLSQISGWMSDFSHFFPLPLPDGEGGRQCDWQTSRARFPLVLHQTLIISLSSQIIDGTLAGLNSWSDSGHVLRLSLSREMLGIPVAFIDLLEQKENACSAL